MSAAAASAFTTKRRRWIAAEGSPTASIEGLAKDYQNVLRHILNPNLLE
jgi:hypothetical protein